MGNAQHATVRMLGCLHTLRRERGLATTVDVALPEDGTTAVDLAGELDLPLDKIEAVFCNHRVYPLGHGIRAGDAVAFVPRGTPGPHRYTLGIHSAGKQSADPEGRAR
jgi:hypothetical protein